MADHNENLSGQAGVLDIAGVISSEIGILLIGLSLACTAGTVSVPNNAHAPVGQSVSISQGTIAITGAAENVSITTPSRTNLVLQSQTLAVSPWALSHAGITSDAYTAPDGTLTADKIYETTNGTHFLYQSYTWLIGVQYTISVYAKMDGNRYLILSGLGITSERSFDLQAGTVGSIGSASYTIEVIDGGYYRVSITFTQASTVVGDFRLFTSNVDSYTAYTGDGSSGVILWGVQIENNSSATKYIPTTSSQVTVTGNELSQGSISVVSPSEHSPSGQTLNLTQGSIVAGATLINESVAGQSATFDQASIVVGDISLALIGRSLSLSRGTVASGSVTSDSVNLTGLTLSLTQNNVILDAITADLVGLSLSLGFTSTMDFDLAEGISGQGLIVSRGFLTVPGDTPVVIPGLDLVLLQGSITVTSDWAESILGRSLGLAQSALFIASGVDDSAPIAGLGLTLSRGSLGVSNNVYPTGQVLAFAQGSIAAFSNVTLVEIEGQVLTSNINELCNPAIYEDDVIAVVLYTNERCV